MFNLFWILLTTIYLGTSISGNRHEGDRDCWPLKIDPKQDSFVCVCDENYCDSTEFELPPSGQYVAVTSDRDGKRFEKKFRYIEEYIDFDDDCYNIKLDLMRQRLKLKINREKTFQKMLGFGAAFTDAAGINAASLSWEMQERLLRSYYTPDDGLNYSMGRVPIGGTDFSTRPYTYDDGVGDDPELKHFALQKEDLKYKIPFIKRAIDMAPTKMLLTSAAWSPPLFMKNKNNFTGKSRLNKKYQQSYANYHIRFLEEYKKNGIEFWSITPGNEPINGLFSLVPINDCGWLPDDMANFVIKHFGPAIKNSEFNATKILLLDDSRPTTLYFLETLMKYKELENYTHGLALHWYFDGYVNAEGLEKVLKEKPEFQVYTTEMSAGAIGDRGFKLGDWGRAETYAKKMIGEANHHSSAFIDWNFALNYKTGGPLWVDNKIDALIFVDGVNNRFFKQTSYYAMGHFSKSIPRGSFRVEAVETTRSDLDTAAFLRPDGYIAVLLHNSHNHTVYATVEDEEKGVMSFKLTPKSITTIIY